MNNQDLKFKLESALTDSVALYNGGSTANDAITKVAEKYDFNVAQTERLVEIFNTARTLHHFKTASANEKSSVFDLADKDAIVLGLFGKPCVTDAVPMDKVSENYVVPRDYNVEDIELPPVKVADTAEFSNLNTQYTRFYKYAHSTAKLIKDARAEASTALTAADLKLYKVVELLKQGSDDIVKDKTARLFLVFSDEAYIPIMQKVAESLPGYITFDTKYLMKYGSVIDTRQIEPQVELVKSAKSLIDSATSLLSQSNELLIGLNEFKDEFVKVANPEMEGNNLSDFFTPGLVKAGAVTVNWINQLPSPTGTGNVAGGSSSSGSSSGNSNSGGTNKGSKDKDKEDKGITVENLVETGPAFGGGGGGGRGGFSPVGEVGKAVFSGAGKKLTDDLIGLFTQQGVSDNKKITSRLKNLHRQTILEDLIINDPVISEVDPEITAKAFSTISQLAPEVSLNKEVVRAILRQSVNSLAVSPYDAEQWLSLERRIREVSGIMPSREKDEKDKK